MKRTGMKISPGPTLVALMLAVSLLAIALPAKAQDLAAERDMTLTIIGDVRDVDINLFPLPQPQSLGLVFVHEISEPGALSLRIHFTIQRSGEAWGIQVKDENGDVVWSTWNSAVSGDGFWSDEIAGEKVTIDVYSSKPSNLLQLKVDQVAIGRSKITPVSITEPNQLRSINGQAGWIVDLGRSVARLRFVGDNGKMYVCTAFLVTSDLMMTNQHCISSTSEMESTLVDFDYDTDGSPGLTLRLSALLETDYALDYSVIRLVRPVGRTPFELATTSLADGQQLLIIQHPGGEPKQISLEDCTVDGVQVTGRLGTPTDFGHQCDTKGGSSGSPVLEFGGRTVVGLHHLGIREGSSELYNRASHIQLVLDDLDPVVRAEIEGGQQ